MAPRPRTLILSGVALAVAAGLAIWAFRPQPVAVDLHEVARAPMRLTVNADGKTRIRNVYEVAAPIAGTARRSPVRVGDPVRKDDTVVAVVEPVAPSLLDTRSRIQAEAAVREAEAALDLAETRVEQARVDLAYAQGQLERTTALVDRGVSSLTQLEDATQKVRLKEAELETAESSLQMSKGSLERARAALIEPMLQKPDGATDCCVDITAPADGVVLEIPRISEGPVAAGTVLLSIGAREDLEIVADLLSSEAVRIAPGAPAEVDRWGGDTPLEARVRSIEPAAYTKVSALGIEEQRVDVILDILTPVEDRPGLGDGFSVYLRIVEWQAEDILQVPLSALFRSDGGWALFAAEDGAARLREVEIGHRNATMAEVLSGVEPGARVIMHPSDQVGDGTSVVDRRTLQP